MKLSDDDRKLLDDLAYAPLTIQGATVELVESALAYFHAFADGKPEVTKIALLNALSMAALIYGRACDCPLCEAHRAARDARKAKME